MQRKKASIYNKNHQKMTSHLDNSTLDNLLEGFQLISFDWRYLYINETAAKHGKSSKEELLGHTMMEKYPGIEKTAMFKTLERCMYNRVSEQIENEFTHPDGTKGWFELRVEPVSGGLFILSLDISDRKNAQNKLLKLNESLEQIILCRTAELVTKNKNITESMEYAKLIQQAKLPERNKIYDVFPQSFILYKPKDIISGDFYYFHKNKENIFIASADCTGHGVPGALMSMIGSEKLDEAMQQSTDTSKILSILNKGIKFSLKQSSKGSKSMRDGMDIALCSVNTDNRIVKYAGANRPIWIIRDGEEVVEEIKPTKKSIGGFTEENQYFDTHEIKLQKGDTFYISTDGYADTFGGKKNKKLKTKFFKQILLDIKGKTMREQKLHLNNFIENWKGELEQVDDILVIGVRL